MCRVKEVPCDVNALTQITNQDFTTVTNTSYRYCYTVETTLNGQTQREVVHDVRAKYQEMSY